MKKNEKWLGKKNGRAEEKGMKLRFLQNLQSGKKGAVAAAFLASAVLAAGCGKQQGTTTAQKEFVYVPEFVKLDMEDGIDQMKVVGDTIYFVSGHWDDAANAYRQYL